MTKHVSEYVGRHRPAIHRTPVSVLVARLNRAK